MIQVRKLELFTLKDEQSLGLNGFETEEIYEVSKREKQHELNFTLTLKKLDKPLTKKWPHLETDINWYNKIIQQGLSFGAYESDRLVGVIISEKRVWNNSLWIADFVVAETYRSMGIGSLLMNHITKIAKEKNFRIIALETQNINVPAISFYRKNGFELEGIDLSLYTNEDAENKEIAIYMKYKII